MRKFVELMVLINCIFLVMYQGDNSDFTFYLGITAKTINLPNFLYIILNILVAEAGFQPGNLQKHN